MTSSNDKRIRISNYFIVPSNIVVVSSIGYAFCAFPILMLPISIIEEILITYLSVFAICILITFLCFFIRIKHFKNLPGEQTLDAWLIDDIDNLKTRALERLNICNTEQTHESLVIKSPILWKTNGIKKNEITFKNGKDKKVRFSIYQVIIVIFTEHSLSFYQCDYNFIKGIPLNEKDYEFSYKDVVSVATEDNTTNYKLPNNVVMRHCKLFKLSLTSGDSIQTIISSKELLKYIGGSLPETGVDNVVKTIRSILRETKFNRETL